MPVIKTIRCKNGIRLEIPPKGTPRFAMKFYPARLDKSVKRRRILYRYFHEDSFRMDKDGERYKLFACPIDAWKAGRCTRSMKMLQMFRPVRLIDIYIKYCKSGVLKKRYWRTVRYIDQMIKRLDAKKRRPVATRRKATKKVAGLGEKKSPKLKMYAMKHDGTPGRLLATGDTLDELTRSHHGRAHGKIYSIDRVGGQRHHLMVWDDGRPDREQRDHPPHLLVLLPGDTNYPKGNQIKGLPSLGNLRSQASSLTSAAGLSGLGMAGEAKKIGAGIEPIKVLPRLKAIIRDMGYSKSAADWADEDFAYAFSKETWGPATYGAPKAEAAYSNSTGWLYTYGEPAKKGLSGRGNPEGLMTKKEATRLASQLRNAGFVNIGTRRWGRGSYEVEATDPITGYPLKFGEYFNVKKWLEKMKRERKVELKKLEKEGRKIMEEEKRRYI